MAWISRNIHNLEDHSSSKLLCLFRLHSFLLQSKSIIFFREPVKSNSNTKVWFSYYWSKRNLKTTSILIYVLAPSVERSNITTQHPFWKVRLILLCELLLRQQMRAITPIHENKFAFAYFYHLVPHRCENYTFSSSVHKYYSSFKKLERWIIPFWNQAFLQP